MKIRLDQYLVQNGLVQSRERAKALIMAGVVFVNQQKVDKAGEMIKEDAVVEVRGHDIGYVSRGGLKLEKAMKCFPLTPNGKVDVYKRQRWYRPRQWSGSRQHASDTAPAAGK